MRQLFEAAGVCGDWREREYRSMQLFDGSSTPSFLVMRCTGLLTAEEVKTDLSGGLKVHATLINSRWRQTKVWWCKQQYIVCG